LDDTAFNPAGPDIRLVCHDDEPESRNPQPVKTVASLWIQAVFIEGCRREAAPVAEIRHDEHTIPIEEDCLPASRHSWCSPFGRVNLQRRMRHEAMPDHCLERFRQRGHPVRIDLRYHDDDIAARRGMAVVTPYDAENPRAAGLAKFHRFDDIDADLALRIAATNRKDEDGVIRVQAADLEPAGKNRVPTFIIGSGRQFGYVVYRTIGLNSTEFPKVIDCVTAISSASADAKQEKTPTSFTKRDKFICHLLDRTHIEAPRNFYDIGKELRTVRQNSTK
jgi:hypothetical protein